MTKIKLANPKRVIVIGAGMSGLAAADLLLKSGLEVTILEARTRPGGRIETLRDFADGVYAEAGAMSIPDSHHRTLKYVDELNLSLRTEFSGRRRAALFYLKGQAIPVRPGQVETWPATLQLTAEERKIGLAGMQKKYLDDFMPNVGDPFAPDWPPQSLLKYDGMSAHDFFLSQGASEAAAMLLGMGLYDLDGNGTKSFSALLMLATEVTVYQSTRSYVPAKGMDELPTELAAKLTSSIRYGAPVVRNPASTGTPIHRASSLAEASISSSAAVAFISARSRSA